MNNESIRKVGQAEMLLRVVLVIMSVISVFGFVNTVSASGATQISGIGYFSEEGECIEDVTGPDGQSPDFANRLEGDLEGCLYVFVETFECHPSGTYIETGTELYVGNGEEGNDGTFRTSYRFTGKFDDCSNLSGQIFGRCQHPIIADSGTGDYAGVTGRLDFKDDVAAGNFPYTGHLK